VAGRAEFWAGHIEAQRSAGRSQRAYCEQHGIRPRTFRRWALRLQRRREAAAAAALDAAPEALASPGAGARTSTGTEEVLLPGPVAEILTGPELRRRWTEEQKLRLVAETFRPGASISAVARRHGVHSSVLFRWRRRFTEPAPAGETALVPVAPRRPDLVPVRVVADAPEPASSPPPASAPVPAGAAGLIEIELARGQRVRVDRHVDADALRRVLAVLGAAGDAA
jgi:transposase